MTIRHIEDVSPLERLALIDISYSRLDTYEMCPARYFYTYIEKQDRLFGAAAALGNIIHGVLELAEELDLTEMVKILDDQKHVYDPEGQIDQKMLDTGWRMLVDYVDRHVGQEPVVLGREVGFALVIGSALVSGYIDRVERDPDSLVRVTDFKTGKWEYRGRPKDNLQLGIYALAATKIYGVDEVYAELYYLRSGNRIGHHFRAADFEGVEARVLKMVGDIINDRHFHPTEDHSACRICDFAKNGVCKKGVERMSGGYSYR
jgi:CRISPR/Cas system-associated exonuclease Cas4 (RecB family)